MSTIPSYVNPSTVCAAWRNTSTAITPLQLALLDSLLTTTYRAATLPLQVHTTLLTDVDVFVDLIGIASMTFEHVALTILKTMPWCCRAWARDYV